MKMPTVLPAAVLAAVLGLGLCTGIAQAQTTSDPDHSATVGQAISDSWITAKIKGELATTKGIESTKVTVDTANGTVTLTGVLASETAVKKTIAVAKSVKGVKAVDASGLKVK